MVAGAPSDFAVGLALGSVAVDALFHDVILADSAAVNLG